MAKYDAVVLGGGPGGYECAIRISQNGLKTALIEEDELGGTCLNRGCIPTKALLHAADIYTEAQNSAPFGINISGVSFDYAKIIERKNAVVKQLTSGVGFLEKSNGVEVIKARGTMTGPHTISLSTGDTVEADYVVLATGSVPARIPIPGIDLPGVVDSTGVLDITECPKAVVIVGGGVIGTEFATFFSRLGVQVTIVEMIDRILGPLDKEIADLVARKLKKNGVKIFTGVKVTSIEAGLKVNYEAKDGAKGVAEGDIVLMAGGRWPNSKNVGFEQIGLQMNKRGFVEVDGLCRTNLPGVYAIGDLNGKMQLAHVATAQGFIVADHIAGKKVKALNMNHIPSCVYCSPEAAMVGLTEEQAKATGRELGVGKFNLSGNGKALTMGENEGIVKFVYDKTTDEILGCHILGPRATDLIAEVVSVMECEGTVAEIGSAVHPHPTVSEAVMEAAHVCHGKCANAPKPKK